MARLQGIELEDQPWFPGLIRGYMTDFLSFMAEAGGERPLGAVLDRLAPAFQASGADRLVELASGGGAPGRIIRGALSKRVGREVGLLQTDLFPNLERLEAGARASNAGLSGPATVAVVPTPVDATAVPPDLRGFRLMCNAFHHLSPALGRKVLADAVAQRQGVAIVEFTDRSPGGMLQVFFGFFVMFLATPFVRPFSLGRLFFTYLVPVVLLATVWDGVMSCLRIYSPEELRALVREVPGADGYRWDIDAVRIVPVMGKVVFLIGVPRVEGI